MNIFQVENLLFLVSLAATMLVLVHCCASAMLPGRLRRQSATSLFSVFPNFRNFVDTKRFFLFAKYIYILENSYEIIPW